MEKGTVFWGICCFFALAILGTNAGAADSVDEGSFSVTDFPIMDYLSISGTQRYDYAAEVFTLINQERSNEGQPSVQRNAFLERCAMKRAAEIAVSFSHTRPNGTQYASILGDIPILRSGENIAIGQFTPEMAMDDWMNSAGHRANILGPFIQVGIGCFYYHGVYCWVQIFGFIVDTFGTYQRFMVDTDRTDIADASVLVPAIVGYEDVGFHWTLNNEGVLTIQGHGGMPDKAGSLNGAWGAHRGQVKEIVIGEGITSVGDWTFPYYDCLEKVTFPNSVTHIGIYSFSSCSHLRSLIIPKTITSLGTDGSSVFLLCNNITDVYYSGAKEEWNAIIGLSSAGIPDSATIHYNSVGPGEPDNPRTPDVIAAGTMRTMTERQSSRIVVDYSAGNLSASTTYCLFCAQYNGKGQMRSVSAQKVIFDSDFHAELEIPAQETQTECRIFLLDSLTFAPAAQTIRLLFQSK